MFLFLPRHLKDTFIRHRILGWQTFFSFSTSNKWPCLLACTTSDRSLLTYLFLFLFLPLKRSIWSSKCWDFAECGLEENTRGYQIKFLLSKQFPWWCFFSSSNFLLHITDSLRLIPLEFLNYFYKICITSRELKGNYTIWGLPWWLRW